MNAGRRAVVVGGRGVIGGAIVDALDAAGWDVVVGTHDARAVDERHRFADLDSIESLRLAVHGADVVVQSANFPGYPIERPRLGHSFERYDGAGTERLAGAGAAGGVRR